MYTLFVNPKSRTVAAGRLLLATFFLVCLQAHAAPTRTHEEPEPLARSASYEERGVARAGSDLHVWLSARFGGVDFATPISYSITEPLDSYRKSGRFLDRLAKEVRDPRHGGMSKDITYTDPSPPGSPDPTLGDTNVMSLGCMDVSVGGNPATAAATFTWTFQNRTDTNGDGSNDSNPGWVITGVSFRDINYDQQSVC